jgi:drug/metabolite transporter (DMT)-like permease
MQPKSAARVAFLALLGGATGIGFAPIFVRLSEVGPSATGFYRLLFSLPALFLISGFDTQPAGARSDSGQPEESSLFWNHSPLWLFGLAGLCFAGDLAFWHWSIRLTSVANATLLTNCAPFFVMLGARALFSERLTNSLVLGLIVAALGAGLLVGSGSHASDHDRRLLGDVLALITALFYAGYLLTVKYLRVRFSTAKILAWSGLVSCVLLLVVALLSREVIWASSTRGWLLLFGLAVISHLAGQGLITWALAHLPAGFSSISLLFQPVVAAGLAWLLLFEPLGVRQAVGGAVVLGGIALASLGQLGTAPARPIQVRAAGASDTAPL